MSAVTLLADATTYTLPSDLQFTDEYSWLPTAQQIDVAFDGSLIIEESAQLFGRPITMVGEATYGWMDHALVEQLRVLAGMPRSIPMTLTLLDGRVFGVLFRHERAAPAVEGKPILPLAPPQDGDSYTFTLRFLQVS
jgi:hypothetical protein